MATYRNGKKVDEKKVGLTVNVFVKDDDVDEVTLGSHLGQGALKLNDDDEYTGFSHFRPGSKLPVRFYVDELGEQDEVDVPTEGMKEKERYLDALGMLDESEKADALTEEEKALLTDVPLSLVRYIAIQSHAHEPPTTPLEEAAIAVLQHELPKPEMEHNTVKAPGPLTDPLVTLYVGEHEFTEESTGFLAERKACADGRTLYQYNWTGVNASVLNEP